MPRLAATFATTPGSGLQEMAMAARGVTGAIHLEIGDPNFTTPDHIIDAAAAAAHAGFTHYPPSAGIETLREALAAKVRDRNHFPCSPEQVVVTTGAAGGLFTTLLVLLDPGDEVLIPNPGWPTYPAMVHVLNAVPVSYPMRRQQGFVPDIAEVEALITRRTKILIISSPANPTGVVYSRDTISAFTDLATRHDLWLISDECYDEIILEGEHVSVAAVDDSERVISVFTFSKTYAMTGWRIGYVVGRSLIANAVTKAQRPVLSATSIISQKGAEAALLGSQAPVREMVEAYRSRRDLTMRLLDEASVPYVRPKGAFYIMVDVAPATNSTAFAKALLTERLVSVTPASAFGSEGEGMVRVSLAVGPEALAEGIPRLVQAIRDTPPVPGKAQQTVASGPR